MSQSSPSPHPLVNTKYVYSHDRLYVFMFETRQAPEGCYTKYVPWALDADIRGILERELETVKSMSDYGPVYRVEYLSRQINVDGVLHTVKWCPRALLPLTAENYVGGRYPKTYKTIRSLMIKNPLATADYKQVDVLGTLENYWEICFRGNGITNSFEGHLILSCISTIRKLRQMEADSPLIQQIE